jgi:hypothetical protein
MPKYEYTVTFTTAQPISQETGAEFWKFAKDFGRKLGTGSTYTLDSYVENYASFMESVDHIEGAVEAAANRFEKNDIHITALSITEVEAE